MDFLATLTQWSTPDALMLDIGANVGGHTNLMLERKGEIHAFEPCPALAIGIQKRFQGNPRVAVYQQGVSDHCYTEKGMTVFEAWTLGKSGEANKRGLSLGALDLVGKEPFDVQFTTIDRHVRGLRRVSFIKIDVDGYELRVLRGGMETIMRDRPRILIELGYLVEDIGDSNLELLHQIFNVLHYSVYDDQGASLTWVRRDDWFPKNTTKDFAIIPSEEQLCPK